MKIAEIFGMRKDKKSIMMNIKKNSITGSQIVRLTSCIGKTDMTNLAVKYMSISTQTVSNLQYENMNNPEDFTRSLIRYWVWKNPGPEQVEVSKY